VAPCHQGPLDNLQGQGQPVVVNSLVKCRSFKLLITMMLHINNLRFADGAAACATEQMAKLM
jgi:hypothetical protein